MQIDLKKLSIAELKILAYDTIVQKEQAQILLNAINQEIVIKMQEDKNINNERI